MKAPVILSRVASWALLAVGLIVSVIGAIWCANTAIALARSEKTVGEIVRVEKVQSKGGWAYHPVFAYRDHTGHRWEGRTPFNTASYAEFQPGQKVAVVFDPKEPMVSNLDTWTANWTLPVFVFVWGAFFLFFAWRMKKPNQALEPTCTSVTPRAFARVAPAAHVAHL